MRLRRATGVFVGLLTLQLVLASSDIICPQHGDRETPVNIGERSQAPHEHHHNAPSEGRRHAPSDLPSVPDCCQAMTTCSSSVALGNGEVDLPIALAHDAAIALVAATPRSRVEAPDPPPPKA